MSEEGFVKIESCVTDRLFVLEVGNSTQAESYGRFFGQHFASDSMDLISTTVT